MHCSWPEVGKRAAVFSLGTWVVHCLREQEEWAERSEREAEVRGQKGGRQVSAFF